MKNFWRNVRRVVTLGLMALGIWGTQIWVSDGIDQRKEENYGRIYETVHDTTPDSTEEALHWMSLAEQPVYVKETEIKSVQVSAGPNPESVVDKFTYSRWKWGLVAVYPDKCDWDSNTPPEVALYFILNGRTQDINVYGFHKQVSSGNWEIQRIYETVRVKIIIHRDSKCSNSYVRFLVSPRTENIQRLPVIEPTQIILDGGSFEGAAPTETPTVLPVTVIDWQHWACNLDLEKYKYSDEASLTKARILDGGSPTNFFVEVNSGVSKFRVEINTMNRVEDDPGIVVSHRELPLIPSELDAAAPWLGNWDNNSTDSFFGKVLIAILSNQDRVFIYLPWPDGGYPPQPLVAVGRLNPDGGCPNP